MIVQECRQAIRNLIRAPRFGATVVITLALTVGGAGALLSLLNAVVLRPLGVADPERLVAVYPGSGEALFGIPVPTLQELNARQHAFTELCGASRGALTVELNGSIVRRANENVDGRCFRVLGVVPFLGRLIGDEDAPLAAGAAPVVVLSHRFWRREFGSDINVVGRTLRVQGTPLTIIGVTSPGFSGFYADQVPDITVSLGTISRLIGGRPLATWSIGRLRDGVTIQQARAQIESLWPAVYADTNPIAPGQRVSATANVASLRVVSAARGFSDLRTRYAQPLYALIGLAALLWLLACVNIGGLFLSRTIGRERDLRVQASLGASRWRLAVQIACEGFALALASAALSLPLAWWTSQLLAAMLWTSTVPMTISVTPSLGVLLLVGAVGLITGLLVSIPPVLLAGLQQRHLVDGSSRTTTAATRWRRRFIVAQMAASLVLLFCAGLFGRNLTNLQTMDPGFSVTNLVFARLDLVPGLPPSSDYPAYLRSVIDGLLQSSGVKSVAFSMAFPTTEVRHIEALMPAFRAESASESSQIAAATDLVTPGFFETAGIQLVQGRDFTWQDDSGQPEVAVISTAMAAKLFPSDDALGARVRTPTGKLVTVVGIARDASGGDVRVTGFPRLYVPLLQDVRRTAAPMLLVRATNRTALLEDIRTVLTRLGRHSISFYRTADFEMDVLLARERVLASLSSSFAVLGVVVGALGVYALLAYGVTRRTREIGIRLALGATRGRLLTMIMREGMVMALVGIVVGLPLAIGAGSMARSLLFGISPFDGMALASSIVVLVLVTAAACAAPALRASRIEVSEALRTE